MKKIILTLCFIVMSSGVFAQLALDENFDYTAADSLGSLYTGWVSFSGGATNRVTIASGSLSFPGYLLSGVGNSVNLAATGQDIYKNLTQDSIKTGSVYCSFLVRVDTAKNGDYFLALLQSGSTTFYEGRVNLKKAVTTGLISFGITKGNASTDLTIPGIWSDSIYTVGTTYALVLKYTFVPGGTTNDQVSLYVFNSSFPATEPGTATVGPITYLSQDASAIGRVALRQGTFANAPALGVDGIRVSTTWFTTALNLKVAVQGLFNGTVHSIVDTMLVNLRSSVSPYPVIASSYAAIDATSLTGWFPFSNSLPAGNYYLEVKYRNLASARNGINTWSATTLALGPYNAGVYNFTNAAGKAFGSNQVAVVSAFATYNGDSNQDGTIDSGDLSDIDNAAVAGASGYINTDLNGDDFVDSGDLSLVDNNAAFGVFEVTP
ncbi:MAG: hypothetical protein IPI04_09840 [Ignavibacteria bacterium]|nr:hypothetical protein [Ignavibacteria bacterium]MBK9405451.1 hypothetical protein [Ignavibacteria bacterium]